MLCINNPYTDPYFNLAAEEYLLKQFSENILMLWRNSPSVIIGKYQNIWAEVNLEYADQNHIPVVRRSTGGGAVYQDLGNLNFTFIEKDNSGDFDKFTQRMLAALSTMGINASAGVRNTLYINNLKISGSAQCIHRDKVIHHGTLLFDSDLDNLRLSLQGDDTIQDSRAVKSVRSEVANIGSYLSYPKDIITFMELIMEYFFENIPDCRLYTFNDDDMKSIKCLSEEKYSSRDWNFGGSFAKKSFQTF